MKLNNSTAWPLVARVASAALQGLFLIALARTASLETFGIYSTVCATGSILIGICGFGLPARALQNSPLNLKSKSAYLTSAIGISLVIFLIIFGTSTTLLGYEFWISFAAAAFSASEFQNNVGQSSLYSEKRYLEADVFLVLRRLIPLTSLIAYSIFESKSAIFRFISIGFLITWTLGSLRFVRNISFESLVERTLKDSSGYWLTNLWAMLQQLDVILINAFFGPWLSGLYASAVRLASPLHIITSLITSRLVPTLAHIPDDILRHRAWRKANQKLFLGILAMAIFAPSLYWVAPIIFNASREITAIAYVWAFFAAIFSILAQIISSVLFLEGKASNVQKQTRTAVATGMAIIVLAGLGGNFVIASAGIFLSQLLLLYLLGKVDFGMQKYD